jgi:hypothetical protein
MGAELFHADGRTDMTKPIVAFRDFTNAPKIVLVFFFFFQICLACIGVKLIQRNVSCMMLKRLDFTSMLHQDVSTGSDILLSFVENC